MNLSVFHSSSFDPGQMASIPFSERVRMAGFPAIASQGITVLQVNMGSRCNMSCGHCHMGAGPDRNEDMGSNTVNNVVAVLGAGRIDTLDITGGAPELNPHFRFLVHEAGRSGIQVIVRTNLTIFSEPGMQDLPEFYRENRVHLIASLPCYLEQNVDDVRGRGSFKKSIEALRALNRAGFGAAKQGAPLLSLVYNPAGAFLPPDQKVLEADYKRELLACYGIFFTHLYVFTNMPIGRFRQTLMRRNEVEQYQARLASAFNPGAIDKVMCRTILSVGWDGTLYDCDFNQALGLPVISERHRTIREFDHEELSRRMIRIGDHCYGCTAGQGST